MSQKAIGVRPTLKARIKALAARRNQPMTRLLSDLIAQAETACGAACATGTSRGGDVRAIKRVASAAIRADQSAEMLADVVSLFGDSLTRR